MSTYRTQGAQLYKILPGERLIDLGPVTMAGEISAEIDFNIMESLKQWASFEAAMVCADECAQRFVAQLNREIRRRGHVAQNVAKLRGRRWKALGR